MRHLAQLALVILLMTVGLTGTGMAQDDLKEGDPVTKAAIKEVIDAQINAFQRDDGVGAFSFASDGIRALFGTPDRFMKMVQSSYSQIYRPRSVEYRRLLIVRGEPVQEVFFVGLDLTTMLALYRMEQQPDGSWRVNGVMVAETSEQAT